MTQQKKNPMRVILFATLLVCIVMGGGLYFFIGQSVKSMVENETIAMNNLSPEVKKLLTAESVNNLLIQPPVNKPINFKKYLFFSIGSKTIDEVSYSCYYNVDINDRLGTSGYVSDPNIDGLVFEHYYFKTVGYYEDEEDVIDNIISIIKSNEEATEKREYNPEDNIYRKKAGKVCRILTYMSFPDGTVLHRDSIWGSDPPQRKKISDKGTGSIPTNSEVAEQIQKTIL